MSAYQEEKGEKDVALNNSIRCSKVEISGTAISELAGGRGTIAIPRHQIQQITLSYDTRVRSPFCQFFFGFTLLLFGLIGLIVFFVSMSATGSLLIQTEDGVRAIAGSGDPVLPLIPITLWFMSGIGLLSLSGIFQYRYHLLIDSGNGIHKIFFEKSVDIKEIKQFISAAHLQFGYEIEVSVQEKTNASVIQGESGEELRNTLAYQKGQGAGKKVVTFAAMIGRKVIGGLTSVGRDLISFGWRPSESYLASKKKKKKDNN